VHEQKFVFISLGDRKRVFRTALQLQAMHQIASLNVPCTDPCGRMGHDKAVKKKHSVDGIIVVVSKIGDRTPVLLFRQGPNVNLAAIAPVANPRGHFNSDSIFRRRNLGAPYEVSLFAPLVGVQFVKIRPKGSPQKIAPRKLYRLYQRRRYVGLVADSIIERIVHTGLGQNVGDGTLAVILDRAEGRLVEG